VKAAIKLVPKFSKNDVETFLISFEKVAELNNFPPDKYAAILQAHLTGKALTVFTELSVDECRCGKYLFSNIRQNLLTLMHLRTYRSFCGGPALDACVRADAAARQAARGKSARAARSALAASRSVCARSGKCCALIGWPAVAEGIKGRKTNMSVHCR